MADRLTEIEARYRTLSYQQLVQTKDLDWLIARIKRLHEQLERMKETFIITDAQRQVEAAHQALDELGVPGGGLLTERIMYLVSEK